MVTTLSVIIFATVVFWKIPEFLQEITVFNHGGLGVAALPHQL
jgi:hypothetical protein